MAKKRELDELKKLNDEDLAKELNEAYRQLFTLRVQLSTRQQSNTAEPRKVRRRIARIRTLQRARQIEAYYQAAHVATEGA